MPALIIGTEENHITNASKIAMSRVANVAHGDCIAMGFGSLPG